MLVSLTAAVGVVFAEIFRDFYRFCQGCKGRDDRGVVGAGESNAMVNAAESRAAAEAAKGREFEGAEWLSVGKACRLLQVSDVTLRQWGDAGHLQVYRTPGGHRRFWREDLLALAQQGTEGMAGAAPTAGAGDAERSERAALRSD